MNKSENPTQIKGFNWGTGLIIAIVLFICTTLSVVAYLVSLDYQMVAENYYQKAETYQQHIDRAERAKSLRSPAKIVFSEQKENITIQLPVSDTRKNIRGEITLYRPGNSALDQLIPLSVDEANIQYIDASNLARGKWIVKVRWGIKEEQYYQETTIFL